MGVRFLEESQGAVIGRQDSRRQGEEAGIYLPDKHWLA